MLTDRNHVVLSTGYNGPPAALDDDLVPWDIRPDKYSFIIHAEENALWFAIGGWGFDRVKDSFMYCTHEPCADCLMRMIRCGVSKVFVPKDAPPYPMSKYKANPEYVLAAQKYPKLEVVRI